MALSTETAFKYDWNAQTPRSRFPIGSRPVKKARVNYTVRDLLEFQRKGQEKSFEHALARQVSQETLDDETRALLIDDLDLLKTTKGQFSLAKRLIEDEGSTLLNVSVPNNTFALQNPSTWKWFRVRATVLQWQESLEKGHLWDYEGRAVHNTLISVKKGTIDLLALPEDELEDALNSSLFQKWRGEVMGEEEKNTIRRDLDLLRTIQGRWDLIKRVQVGENLRHIGIIVGLRDFEPFKPGTWPLVQQIKLFIQMGRTLNPKNAITITDAVDDRLRIHAYKPKPLIKREVAQVKSLLVNEQGELLEENEGPFGHLPLTRREEMLQAIERAEAALAEKEEYSSLAADEEGTPLPTDTDLLRWLHESRQAADPVRNIRALAQISREVSNLHDVQTERVRDTAGRRARASGALEYRAPQAVLVGLAPLLGRANFSAIRNEWRDGENLIPIDKMPEAWGHLELETIHAVSWLLEASGVLSGEECDILARKLKNNQSIPLRLRIKLLTPGAGDRIQAAAETFHAEDPPEEDNDKRPRYEVRQRVRQASPELRDSLKNWLDDESPEALSPEEAWLVVSFLEARSYFHEETLTNLMGQLQTPDGARYVRTLIVHQPELQMALGDFLNTGHLPHAYSAIVKGKIPECGSEAGHSAEQLIAAEADDREAVREWLSGDGSRDLAVQQVRLLVALIIVAGNLDARQIEHLGRLQGNEVLQGTRALFGYKYLDQAFKSDFDRYLENGTFPSGRGHMGYQVREFFRQGYRVDRDTILDVDDLSSLRQILENDLGGGSDLIQALQDLPEGDQRDRARQLLESFSQYPNPIIWLSYIVSMRSQGHVPRSASGDKPMTVGEQSNRLNAGLAALRNFETWLEEADGLLTVLQPVPQGRSTLALAFEEGEVTTATRLSGVLRRIRMLNPERGQN